MVTMTNILKMYCISVKTDCSLAKSKSLHMFTVRFINIIWTGKKTEQSIMFNVEGPLFVRYDLWFYIYLLDEQIQSINRSITSSLETWLPQYTLWAFNIITSYYLHLTCVT